MTQLPTGSFIRMAGAFLAGLGFFSGIAQAQTTCWSHLQSIGAPLGELDRSFQLAKLAPLLPTSVTRTGRSISQRCAALTAEADIAKRFQWSILPVAVILQNNSAYPRTQQDGMRWAGRGVSGGASGGIAARWGPLSAAVAPTISYHQNENFPYLRVPTPALSPYNNYFHAGAIDWPHRFGSAPAFWADLGQSFIRVDAFGFAAGVSTENMRWGPARQNPIMMSTAGPGFPHFFVGTSTPFNARLVDVTLELISGRLAESNYFDTTTVNDRRAFAGIVATVSPRNSGLTVGITRAFLQNVPPEGFSLMDELIGPYAGVSVNPQDSLEGDNQLVSVFLSLVVPNTGFEAYAEYAREDHWEDANDLLMQLDHSRGYTIGFEDVFLLRGQANFVRVAGEVTNLEKAPTWQTSRSSVLFYTHNQVRQGYTHRGQLLGAPIGPGSSAQSFATDYVGVPWQVGLYFGRARYDNDTYYSQFASNLSGRGHDTEWTLGLRGGRTMRDLQVVLDLAYSKRYNRNFVALSKGQYDADVNVNISLGGEWKLRSSSRRAKESSDATPVGRRDSNEPK